MIPTSIDGTDITGATIDGTDVQEITVDGQTVFTAGIPGVADATLRAHYPIDEGSGTAFADATGNEGDFSGGTLNGTGWISDPDYLGGEAYNFDGTQHATMSPTFATPLTGTFAVAITVNFNDVGVDEGTVYQFDDASALGLSRSTSNTLGIRMDPYGSDASVSTGTNFRILFTSDGTNRDWYINGSLQTETGSSAGLRSNGAGTVLGARDGGGFKLDAIIDNLVIYDEFLSSAQVTEDFNAQPWS